MLVDYLTKQLNGDLSVSGTLSFVPAFTPGSPHLPCSCFFKEPGTTSHRVKLSPPRRNEATNIVYVLHGRAANQLH